MTMQKKIPLFTPRIPRDIDLSIGETLSSGYIAQGALVDEFERRLGDFVENKRVCAVSDISGAITLALYNAGIRPGDHVVLSPMVCLATSSPIANLFAQPVWCDVDPDTGMPSVENIRDAITPATKAIIFSHWSGDVGAIEEIYALAKSRGIALIEDASEAFGAMLNKRPLNASYADYTAYSFGPVRQITCGEGAALLTHSEREHDQLRKTRRYGIDQQTFRLDTGDLNPESDISLAGFNFPFNNIGATLGIRQLAEAADVLKKYRSNGEYFEGALRGIAGVRQLIRRANCQSGYWTFSFRAERREKLVQKLTASGVSCQRLHLRNDLYTCFSRGTTVADLQGVDIFDRENLSIPCGWWLREEDLHRISSCILDGW